MAATRVHPALVAGNVAVVTGAASGIGLAAARRLATLGLRVCMADRDEARLKEAAASVGAAALAVTTDVSDPASIDRLAEAAEANLGPVSVLLNNAGVAGGGDALSNPEGWRRVLGVSGSDRAPLAEDRRGDRAA